ncbi:class I SAM-dependent methyltransferase [Cupriavidus basilensis]|uniref:Class I SAM-dependent methyltransferase n=1 Tax=Cupriavidus basilensis TaxID=68895 RepID=A0ABT6B3L4_9BURK|nr:class I SAM-dependent methyltransferase [Cupriavidus basilensis]MDF3839477.1 class I SAM-dependent methyltransferase [Cupriavidus basilensis]
MNIDMKMDQINRAIWSAQKWLGWFGQLDGWTDRGEAAAVAWVSDRARGAPILDIGVGGGRTVSIMRAISSNYIGIDYTPELLEVCRARHPGVSFRQMDARDMSAFADGSFDLVMFSYNGIDAVDMEGRRAILRESARILRPGGRLLFSTHNMLGPGYRESVWKHLPKWSWNPARYGWRILKMMYALPGASWNYLRNARFNQDFDGYAVHVCGAHNFGLVIQFTTLAHQLGELAKAGLVTERVLGNETGQAVRRGDDTREIKWFHFIARKPLEA